MVHRLVPWLNRELNVLCGVDSQEAMTSILQLILIHPIRCPCFADQIARYTGRHTEHFVHEFHSYATTPYDLVGYDREANYVSHDNLAHMFTEHTVSSDEDVQVNTRNSSMHFYTINRPTSLAAKVLNNPTMIS